MVDQFNAERVKCPKCEGTGHVSNDVEWGTCDECLGSGVFPPPERPNPGKAVQKFTESDYDQVHLVLIDKPLCGTERLLVFGGDGDGVRLDRVCKACLRRYLDEGFHLYSW